MKNFIVLLAFFASHSLLFSQNETIINFSDENDEINYEENSEYEPERSKLSIGLHAGLSQNGTDTHSWGRHGEGIFDHAHLAYGLHAKYSFTQNLGLRADYFGSKISGDDRGNDGPCSDANDEDTDSGCHRLRAWRFTSPIHELSLSAEWDILGKKRYPKTEYFNADGEKLDPKSVRLGYGTYYHENGDVLHFNEVNKFKRKLSPYMALGIAMTYVNPETIFEANEQAPTLEEQLADNNEQKNIYMHIPVTMGLRYDISEKIFIDAEARGVFESTDLLDGMKHVANFDDERNHKDVYQFAVVRIGYRLGISKDMDGDGVPDKRDVCPDVWGIVALNGCPDRDGDGISDEVDACPDVRGLRKFAGCPDTDNDGVQDLLDGCPNLAGTIETKGCPDQDLDGIVDEDDYCPNKFGPAELDGCPDRDGDGIPDHRDACPDVKGEDAYHGCNEGYPSLSEENRKRIEIDQPAVEEYNYGKVEETINTTKTIKREVSNGTNQSTIKRSTTKIINEEPQIKRRAQSTTTQTTNRVIERVQPQTTTTQTTTTRVIENAEPQTSSTRTTTSTQTVNTGSVDAASRNMAASKVFSSAMSGIKFNSSKASFLDASYPVMDEVVAFMQAYPSVKVRVSGHTDSTGDDQRNKILSAQRANAVKSYLVRNGIKRNRMIAKGYGETMPIADNGSPEGRIQNRRVEFSIVE